MSAKSPTPQAISALLRKAGFTRSEKGSAGYAVYGYEGRFADVVIVNPANDEAPEAWERYLGEAESELGRCAEVISASGFAVEFKARPVPKLIVTTKPDSERMARAERTDYDKD